MTPKPEVTMSPTVPEKRPLLGRLDLFCMSAGVNLAFLAILAAIVIRLTIKDTSRYSVTFFYMTPLPVLVFGALVCGVAFRCMATRWRARLAGLVTVCLLVLFAISDWRYGTANAKDGVSNATTVRLLFWNVARQIDLTQTLQLIREQDADIVGVVELIGDNAERRRQIQEALPGYDVSVLGGNMYLMAKGPSGETKAVTLRGGSVARRIPVTLRGQSIQVVVADIEADVLRSREIPLTRLLEFCQPLDAEPCIVMGDFNTPAYSAHLDQFRTVLRNLFDVSGRGYAPTWPFPLPVLQLDQMWVNDKITPLSCRHLSSFASDHRAVLAEVRIP